MQKNRNNSSITSSETGSRLFYGWVVLGICFVLATIVLGAYYCFGVFLKPLQDEFLASRAVVSSVFSVSSLILSLSAVLGGWASDRFGPRIVFAISGPIACAGLILSSRVTDLWQLYISYGLIVSLGSSAAFPTTMATISRWFVKRRGLALGILTAGLACGMMIMPPIVQTLITNYGWRTTMFILSFSSLDTYGVAILLVRRSPQEMGLLPYGLTPGKDRNEDTGKAGATNDTDTSQHNDSTLKEAVRTRDLWLLWALFATLALSMMMVNTQIVRYALDTGVSPVRAALIVSIIGAGGMVGKIVGGGATERIGTRRILIICAATLAVAMFWLTRSINMWMFVAFAVPFGMAYGGWIPSLSVLIADIFGTTHYGKIFAVADTGWGAGGFVGPILAGYMFDTTGSYRIAFWIGASLSLLSIALVLLLRKRDE